MEILGSIRKIGENQGNVYDVKSRFYFLRYYRTLTEIKTETELSLCVHIRVAVFTKI